MARVYAYCGSDVDEELALHRRLGPLPADERDVWLSDQTINERGVALDKGFLAGAQRLVDAARGPLVAEFVKLTGVEPTQRAKVLEWVREQGVEMDNLQKGTIAELLGETDDEDEAAFNPARGLDTLPGDVRRALAIRSLVGSSSISKLSRMEQCIAESGRAHRLLQYHGTSPGRWAGRLFNIANLPRGIAKTPGAHISPDPDTLADAITSGSVECVGALALEVEDPPNSGHWRPANPIEVVASALRHAVVAAPGRVLMEMDFVQIQARIVLALAGQHDFLDKLRAGLDPYCLTAEGIYHKPPGTWNKANCPPEIRQYGKNTFLGSGFQMGPETFCQKYCMGCQCKPGTRPCEAPESAAFEQATTGITAYRKRIAPLVPPVWYALEEAALKAVWDGYGEAYGIEYRMETGADGDGRWLSAKLLDDKKIWYLNPQKAKQQKFGREKDCWTYQAVKQGRMCTQYAYGGLLTENIVMGHERQLLVGAMKRCDANNMPVIFNGYDAVVVEPLEKDADLKALEQIMCEPPDWAKSIKLPINAEGWIGHRFRKG